MAYMGKNKHSYTHSTVRTQEPIRRSYCVKENKGI